MVELASLDQGDGRPATLAEIAGGRQLSLSYLEQLFGRLRRAGLVSATRGPSGGYRLARPASQITVSDIIRAVDATAAGEAPGGCVPLPGSDGTQCRTEALWRALGRHINVFLARVTLADVLQRRIGSGPLPAEPRLDEFAE